MKAKERVSEGKRVFSNDKSCREGLWDSNLAGITGYFPERTFETEELAGPDGLGVGRVVGEEEWRQ